MILQQKIAARINEITTMFADKIVFSLSPNQALKQYPDSRPPFAIVSISGERNLDRKTKPTAGHSNGTFATERVAVVSCLLPVDKKLNAVSAIDCEQARVELIKALGAWSPADDYYETLYDGYQVKEDNAGNAWVDFSFCFYQAMNYDCFSIKQEAEPLNYTFCPV